MNLARLCCLLLFVAACGDVTLNVKDPDAPDADGDGFPNCAQELLGNKTIRCDDSDCDDTNPDVFPGAPVSCDADLDHNCDGTPDYLVANMDCDADGARRGDGDCDDRDSARSPELPEFCGDGLDNDCDLVLDEADCVEAS